LCEFSQVGRNKVIVSNDSNAKKDLKVIFSLLLSILFGILGAIFVIGAFASIPLEYKSTRIWLPENSTIVNEVNSGMNVVVKKVSLSGTAVYIPLEDFQDIIDTSLKQPVEIILQNNGEVYYLVRVENTLYVAMTTPIHEGAYQRLESVHLDPANGKLQGELRGNIALIVIGAIFFGAIFSFLAWGFWPREENDNSKPKKRNGNAPSGFTLIDLMIVLAIIMIIGALSYCHLRRVRLDKNENTAVITLQNTDWSKFQPIEDVVGSTQYVHSGYKFICLERPDLKLQTYGFYFAEPVTPGVTGNNYFWTENGVRVWRITPESFQAAYAEQGPPSGLSSSKIRSMEKTLAAGPAEIPDDIQVK